MADQTPESQAALLANVQPQEQASWSEAVWLDRLAEVIGEQRRTRSPLAVVLPPMLIAIGWTGTGRNLAALLPPPDTPLTPELLERLLADLGFRARELFARGDLTDTMRLRAGSLVTHAGGIAVYLGQPYGTDLWWTEHGDASFTPTVGDRILAVERDPAFHPANEARPNWFRNLFERMRDQLFAVLAISGFINLLAVSVSLYTMQVYSVVIPSGTTSTLWGVALLAFIAAAAGWVLRIGRQSAMSDLSRWAGTQIGMVTMRKMLSFPMDTTARMGILNNVIRMRSFENARQFLTGAGGTYLIDYPFLVIFLLAIALLSGWLVIVPILSLLLFSALAIPTADYISSKASAAGVAAGKVEEHARAALMAVDAFQHAGAGTQWLNRFADLARESAARNRDYAIALARAQAVGHVLGRFTVLATMCTGVFFVLQGAMQAGGLVASMMLIWRIVTPAQQAFGSLVRLRQVRSAVGQVDRLMATPSERPGVEISSPFGLMSATVATDRLYYRPSSDLEAALSGVTFSVPTGQRVAVVGPNAGGKTALLECLAGLRRPQSGRVLINGRDIRQFDVTEYRAWIGYVPQVVPALPITVREYLQLRVPALSDDEAWSAFEQVLGMDWQTLPALACQGGSLLDRELNPFNDNQAEARLRYIVAFIAATLGRPAILLLDGVGLDGDPMWDERIAAYLDSIRGRTTVIWAPYSIKHIQDSDQMLLLERGSVRHFGPTLRPESKTG